MSCAAASPSAPLAYCSPACEGLHKFPEFDFERQKTLVTHPCPAVLTDPCPDLELFAVVETSSSMESCLKRQVGLPCCAETAVQENSQILNSVDERPLVAGCTPQARA